MGLDQYANARRGEPVNEKLNMSNFIEGLLETIHKNTSTNDLHQINTVQCRKAIETYIQYYIKEFGLDQVEQNNK